MRALTVTEGTRGHRLLRLGVGLVGLAFVLLLPYIIGGGASNVDTLSQLAAYAVAIVGLVLLTGYCGQISIGHSAFCGLGAYTTLYFVTHHGWSYLETIPVSLAICLIAGALVGIPALRISGLYLATVTLAIAAVFPTLIDITTSVTGGTDGEFAVNAMQSPTWFPIQVNYGHGPSLFHYWVIVAVAAIMFLVARNIAHSRIGRALIAIRDSEHSAAAAGIRVARHKVFAFAVSAGFAGVAGSLLMIQLPEATDSRFDLQFAIFLLIGLVAGGRASLSGAIPGAIVFVLLRNELPKWIGDLGLFSNSEDGGQVVGVISGMLLIAFAFLLPDGVITGLRRLTRRVVRVRPSPPPGWEAYLMGEPSRHPSVVEQNGAGTAAPIVHSAGSSGTERRGLHT